MGFIIKRELKNGDPRYDARWRDGTGKQHVKTFKRKKDARKHLNSTEAAVDDGTWQSTRPAPMKKVFEAWREHLDTRVKLGEIRASTASTAECNLRCHIEPALEDYRSDKLTARVMAKWRAGLAEKVEAGDMARKSFNNIFSLAKQIMKWARHPAQGYMSHDPLVGQKRLKLRRKEAEFLEDDDIAALLTVTADDTEASALVHVMLFGGLRRGEAFALKWSDVEANGDSGGRLHVLRSVYQGEITPTKTANSERIVDVPTSVLDALQRHREATPPMDDDFIFRASTGAILDPGIWYKRNWPGVRKASGLGDGVGFHTLRHTFASLLLRQGEGLKYTSEQLGHSSVQITGDRYGHVLKSQREEAMGRLDETIRAAKRRRFEVVEGGQGA